MRTTLTIQDRIARDLKRTAIGGAEERPKPKQYWIRAVSLGGVCRGVDLDKALSLADTLEDEERGRREQAT